MSHTSFSLFRGIRFWIIKQNSIPIDAIEVLNSRSDGYTDDGHNHALLNEERLEQYETIPNVPDWWF